MSEQDNVKLIQGMYEAFGRGDMQTIYDSTDPNIVWVDNGPESIPIFGEKHGREGLVNFFTLLADLTDVEMFEPKEFIAQGDRVVALGRYRFRVKATGKAYEYDWAMTFLVKNGLVVRFDEYGDSAQVVEAFAP
jgi:ketosteroid isomerase-like protein